MKKLLILILLFAGLVEAQSNLPKIIDKPKIIRGSAIDLDGTTEYMSKSSPSKLDLNGAERIPTETNRTFESGVGDWTGAGNHSVAQSSTDKKSGTYSMAITSTGAGDVTSNYASLPYTAFTSLGTDANGIYEKYTLEFWARATNANCTITINIGSKSKTSSTLSTVAGTFTKVVFNFQATASEINQGIKIYANQADVVYIDDVSLTKAWDMLIITWAKSNDPSGSSKYIVDIGTAITLRLRTNNNFLYFQTGNPNTPKVAYSFTDWRLVVGIINKISPTSSKLGLNGSLSDFDFSNEGKSFSDKLIVSESYAVTGVKWNGQIGEIQIVRFTDISQSNVNATTLAQAYKLGIPKTWIGGGAEVVAHYKFRGSSDGQMLQDLSGNGNNLSGVNVDINDQTKGNYPTR